MSTENQRLSFPGKILRPTSYSASSEALPAPWIVHEYNMHMNGVDRVAQMIHEYEDEWRNLRYWVALFVFIMHASVVNAFRIYCIRYRAEKFRQMKHADFQRSIAIELIQRSRTHRRTEPVSRLVGQAVWRPEHYWEKLPVRQRCKPCKDRKAARPSHKRKAMEEISGNITKKQKPCISEVKWQCGKCKIPRCRRNRECWEWLHMLNSDEEGVWTNWHSDVDFQGKKRLI